MPITAPVLEGPLHIPPPEWSLAKEPPSQIWKSCQQLEYKILNLKSNLTIAHQHTVQYVLKVLWKMKQTMGNQIIGTFGALRVMLGQEGMEGFGFSTDAAPPWIAGAPFQGDKTGDTEVAKITGYYLVGYLILWLGCSI